MRWRIRSLLLQIAAMLIVALHAGLLWQRIEDLSITEPIVIARWCAAAIAAAAALFLLHLRVSWRSWLVFWIVIVLLHVAAPVQHVRLEVLVEVVFALCPLILLIVGLASASQPGNRSFLDRENFALPIALQTAALPSRAPPAR